MNWGHKIIIVFIVFVAGILFLVFSSANQSVDLVTTDYYSKELRYQEKIDEKTRVAKLSDSIRYQLKNDSLVISFPADFSDKEIAGDVILYCPSDAGKDVLHHFSMRSRQVSVPIPVVGKQKAYELHLSWAVDGLTYYLEKKILL